MNSDDDPTEGKSNQIPDMQFCRSLPKLELHAHINGSISEEVMNELVQLKQTKQPRWTAEKNWENVHEVIRKGKKRTMAEVFDMFKVMHELCDNEEAAYTITRSVIKEFAADNVKYLELRTTTREDKVTGMSKASYIDTVIKAIKDCQESDVDTVVRLLLAIDRRTSPEDAMNTVKMAAQYQCQQDNPVVGIDLSGDPHKGDARDFIPVLQAAQKEGLKLALHLCEVPGYNAETEALLALPPDRIGHGTYLLPEAGGSPQLLNIVREAKIPLELCLSSNVCTQTAESYTSHHLGHWLSIGHPVCICTDDKGIFSTSLSEEFLIAAESFSLTRQDLWNLSQKQIDYIFESDAVKQNLRDLWKDLKESVMVEK